MFLPPSPTQLAFNVPIYISTYSVINRSNRAKRRFFSSASFKLFFHSSAAGSLPQTSHWHVTTEPVFVTKQRPSSSTKPMGSLETTKPLTSSSHFWSENSWTPPRPSLKPHWTDNPSLLQNGPEAFPPRPSFKPTEPQEVRADVCSLCVERSVCLTFERDASVD